MNWEQISQATTREIVGWAASQSWAQAMAQCDQDGQWHAEGDVWTHSKMVVEQLEQLGDWNELSGHQQLVLKFVALLHDVAKPITSVVDPVTGHIRSPKHAVKGEKIARTILRELGCDLETREQICNLVRYHGRPAFLQERDQPVHEIVRMSWLSENRLLFLFALADTRGRKTESMNRPEENLQFWKLLAQEHDCFVRPFEFATDHARITFFRHHEPNLSYIPHEQFSCNVTMMCGIPGAGKDTWLARHRSELPVVSLDELRRAMKITPTGDQGRVIQRAREQCREFLRSGTSFAFNATNLLRQTRAKWLDLFYDYRAKIELVYLEPAWGQLQNQNRSRVHSVPANVVQKLAQKVEPPNWLEGHRLTMIG